MIAIEVRVFNSLRRYMHVEEKHPIHLTLPDGSTPRRVLEVLGIPTEEVYLLMVNGQVPMGQVRNLDVLLEDQDRVAFSGAFPFHRAYRAPVI